MTSRQHHYQQLRLQVESYRIPVRLYTIIVVVTSFAALSLTLVLSLGLGRCQPSTSSPQPHHAVSGLLQSLSLPADLCMGLFTILLSFNAPQVCLRTAVRLHRRHLAAQVAAIHLHSTSSTFTSEPNRSAIK
ncbi:hypothetical protein BDV96DRAFT_293643 [Lophiotrema nucula]|uniref:Uncharacterized protein n=1 Tax=Lophiotrema nucula TaxID=690887 RepID=A0A6A5YL52_9PLEO|nr:hypothetical protein BDV96DRAFT_293643 [Lophiotrema nucula]